MTTESNAGAVARAIRRELPAALAAVVGGEATTSDAPAPTGDGWTVTVPLGGTAAGRALIWFDAAGAAACARRLDRGGDADPDEAALTRAFTAIGRQLALAVESAPEAAGLLAGEPVAAAGPAPASGVSFGIQLDNAGIGVCVAVDLTAAASVAAPVRAVDSRLDAVLDVDLPLVVRFGRTVMPLRSVTELSPGSVVDMGRTPDEPVELLVGDRLIARGEVVIVGGNYGVRITELTGGRHSADAEVRP